MGDRGTKEKRAELRKAQDYAADCRKEAQIKKQISERKSRYILFVLQEYTSEVNRHSKCKNKIVRGLHSLFAVFIFTWSALVLF